MRTNGFWFATVFACFLTGCDTGESMPVTLYRNSPMDHAMRVHFATFDGADKGNYNLSNCQMAARVLNANVDAIAKANGAIRDDALGFWCEPGRFEEKGMVPLSFDSELPTEAR